MSNNKGLDIEELLNAMRKDGVDEKSLWNKMPEGTRNLIRRERSSSKAAVSRNKVDQLAARVVGALADAPDNATRRKALDKARRMLGTR
tara:strand:+ start:178 stop:444 length:267 start_codon:yes stop_codon:yes gene_type:complete